MKRVVCVLLFAGLILQSMAQTPDATIDRRIYLLDVTKSMKGIKVVGEGKNAKVIKDGEDVWDKVVAFLKNDIENITDASTRIIVIPFNDDVCLDCCWEEQATTEGKSELIRKINGLEDRWLSNEAEPTSTNIVGPFRYAKNRYIDPNYNNLMILLTDGKNTPTHGGTQAWLNLLSSWQVYARDNNAYLIYFMVAAAANDEDIVNAVGDKDYSDVVTPTGKIPDFIDLYPSRTVSFNIKDDIEKGVFIQFDNSKRAIKLANGIEVSVKGALPEFGISVDCSAVIQDNKINLKLPYASSELKTMFGTTETAHIPLTVTLLNQDEIQSKYGQKIFLKRNTVDLVLINKIEKVLTIKIKR